MNVTAATMTREERIRRAIGFRRPDRVPVVFWNRDQTEGDVMRIAARHGFHGIHFADDWGTQTGMMISPALWRQLFKQRYARQFAVAHELGLHTWYHCCGEFGAIMEDFCEIGVDVLNIAPPNVNDIGYMGPLSVEWEDSGMDREYGAKEACAFVRKLNYPASGRAFDSAFER